MASPSMEMIRGLPSFFSLWTACGKLLSSSLVPVSSMNISLSRYLIISTGDVSWTGQMCRDAKLDVFWFVCLAACLALFFVIMKLRERKRWEKDGTIMNVDWRQWTDRLWQGERDRQIDRQRDRRADRQAVRQTVRQTGTVRQLPLHVTCVLCPQQVKEKSVSLWSFINSQQIEYINPLYSPELHNHVWHAPFVHSITLS